MALAHGGVLLFPLFAADIDAQADLRRSRLRPADRRDLRLALAVMYKGVPSLFGTGLHPWDADFDGDGNLYLIVSTTKDDHATDRIIRLLRIPAAALAAGGNVVPEVVADNLQTECGARARLRVSCDGSAYVALKGCYDAPPGQSVFYGGALLKIQDGQVVANIPVTDGQLNDLALTCAGEVYGTKMKDVWFNPGDNEVWRSVDGGPLARIVPLPNSVAEEKLTVSPAGNIYISYYVPAERAILKVPYQVPDCGLAIFQHFCLVSPIRILPSTTRWRPQRDGDPINVVVGSSVELDTAQPFTLRYTGKEPDGTVVVATTEIPLSATALETPPQGYAYGYSLDWNHVDGTEAKLPAANYTLVVKAPVLSNQSPPPPPLESAQYEKVSLVEVVAITIEHASGVALPNNPAQGGGKRIFAEAEQIGGTVTDKLKVNATILPPVPGQSVIVHFRSFDVDDPSAATAPVDNEEWLTDNCIGAHQEPQQNCPIPDAGYLYNPATDPPSPVDGTIGLPLNASGAKVVAGLRVAMLAGANYRVVASTSSQWLGTLTAPGNRLDGAVLDGTTVLPEGEQVTPMVTVWRTLHLRPVRMTLPSFPQSELEYQATATCPTPPCVQGNVLTDTNGIPHPDHELVTDTWMQADVDVTPSTRRADKFTVINSTATTLTADVPLTPYDPTFAYALWDDETRSLSFWTQPDHSLAQTILRDAYIEVDDIVAAASPSFVRNLTHAAVAALPTVCPSCPPGYWTAPLVMAFEGPKDKDGDPSFPEEFFFGLTNGPESIGPEETSRWPRVAILSETIRDYKATPPNNAPPNLVSRDEIMTNTTAHEILHLFGLRHDGNAADGGIMCALLYLNGDPEANGKKVTPEQLKLIRVATEMKIRRKPEVECP